MSEIKKQTAVEWLFEHLYKVEYGTPQGERPNIFEQAKQMEEDQRMELADAAYEAGKLDSEFSNMFDDPKARFMNSVKNNNV
jgi:hemoglobin-like flavoprotein